MIKESAAAEGDGGAASLAVRLNFAEDLKAKLPAR